MSTPLLLALLAAASLIAGGTAHGQDSDDTDDRVTQVWPSQDVTDLWHKFRPKDPIAEPDTAAPSDDQRRFFVIAPAIGSRPSTGLTLGVNGNLAFFQGGDSQTTHISTVVGGFRVSQKKQVLSNVRFSVFTKDDRWFLQGDNRVNWTSLNTYPLGTDAGTPGSANVRYNFVRLYETAYRTIKPGLFVGGGVNLNARSNIRAGDGESGFDSSSYAAYSERNGFALDKQVSTGGNVGLLYDTRDNSINATRGWLASSAYRTFFRGLGGDATWQELAVDVRTYRRLTRNGSQRIAFWLMSDLVTGGAAPYLDLPTTGGDVRSGRGYSEGRFRGEHLVYGEVEYRGALTPNGLLGFVAFLNSSTIGSSEAGTRLFQSYAPAAGVGLRVLLNKRSRTNFATDWGWGKDGSRGFYLGIQEAF
jgi:outer membrane protein assembly factor BamA